MYQLKNIQLLCNNFSLKIDFFNAHPGDFHVIVGPNGAGKSTFLDLLAFLRTPSQGDVIFKGRTVDYSNETDLLNHRRRISYLLQNPFLFSTSVFNNVASGLRIRNCTEKKIVKKTNHILDKFAISHLAQRNVFSLSGGEAQLVALARTLVIDADIYLLDEPTANIDKENLRTVENWIQSLQINNQASVIMTTHSRDQAYRMSKNIISMMNGEIKNLPYENVFNCRVVHEDGIDVLWLNDSVKIKLDSSAKNSFTTIAVDPKNVILSREAFASSALNNFEGEIKKIEAYNGSLQIFVDIGVTFCALITQKSYTNLGLNIGSRVWIAFKANSVKVIS